MIDRAFLNSEDKDFVPLYVMEDLISGNQKLMLKFFNALVKNDLKNNARGFYNREKFSEWAPFAVQKIGKKINYILEQD